MNNFSQNLKKLRKQKGLTQDKLAELVGVSRATINSYEKKGNYPRGTVVINRLISALDCDEADLLGYDKVGASYTDYAMVNINDLRIDTEPDDDYSVPFYDSEILYPVDPYLKRRYKSGRVIKDYCNMYDNVVQTGSVIFFSPFKDESKYDNKLCLIKFSNKI